MDSYLLSQCYTFIILKHSDKDFPILKEDRGRRTVLQKLMHNHQYLCHREKRVCINEKISKFTRFLRGKEYSFLNVRSAVEWWDVKVYLAPLELAIRREIGDEFKSMNQFVSSRKVKAANVLEIDVNWEAVLELLSRGFKSKFHTYSKLDESNSRIKFDELIDKYYDEIKMTMIRANSYRLLFGWFGEVLIEIGYKAFDIFMRNRDGEQAWKDALSWHVKDYNFGLSLEEELLNQHLYPLLKF